MENVSDHIHFLIQISFKLLPFDLRPIAIPQYVTFICMFCDKSLQFLISDPKIL